MKLPTGVARSAAAGAACAWVAWAGAPTALAGDRGAGLYEPFTGAASTKAANRYVQQLARGRLPEGRRLGTSLEGLRSGVFVNEGRPVAAAPTPRAGAATARAKREDNSDGPLSAGLGIAALALGLLAARAAPRRR